MTFKLKLAVVFALSILGVGTSISVVQAAAPPAPNPQAGSLGLEGQVGGGPPTTPATITVPGNGQVFNSVPITVSGICTKGLLVEVFSNGVFVGSAQCSSGSFSLLIDLFNGQNDLVVRQYDALNQSSPDSNTVSVTYNSPSPSGVSRPTLTTAYAKRGADPKTSLSWPMTISGGSGPYAISIDWGDKTQLDLLSRKSAGGFSIEHTYNQSGIFNVTVKAVDSNGAAAFLQLVAIANGPIQQGGVNSSSAQPKAERVFVWWPVALTFCLTFVAFWLGKKHQLETIRSRLRRGERPI